MMLLSSHPNVSVIQAERVLHILYPVLLIATLTVANVLPWIGVQEGSATSGTKSQRNRLSILSIAAAFTFVRPN